MRRAVFAIMALGLLRDRGALVMTFALPPLIFVIFASVFSGTGGDSITLKVAIADGINNDLSSKVVSGLTRDTRLERVGGADLTAQRVEALVRAGTADVGLVLVSGPRPFDTVGPNAPAPFRIVVDPSRRLALPMLTGILRQIYQTALSPVQMTNLASFFEQRFGPLSPEQRERIRQALEAMRASSDQEVTPSEARIERLFEISTVRSASRAESHIIYYAGAVAILFLLFSAVQGAVTLLEERESGVLDRIAVGPGGIGVFIDGKFAFMTVQGFAQAAAIFVVAWLAYGVSLLDHLHAWVAITLLAAAACSGLGLALASLCKTRRQALTLGNFSVLIISAVGGSMVPRFLMPDWLQDVGWSTPNAWTLEAYMGVFWRGESLIAQSASLGALAIAAATGFLAARLLASKSEKA